MSEGGGRHGLLLLTLGLLLGLHSSNRFGIAGIFGPLRVRFRAAYAAVGNLFSAYPLAYACSQIPAGYLADRLDSRRLILVGTSLATVTGIVFAVTPVYGVALVCRLIAGVGGALIYTPAMTLGIAAFPPAKRGMAIGAAYTGVGIGTASSLAVLPILVARFGLTSALLGIAGFAGAMTILAPIGMAIRRPEGAKARQSVAGLLRQRAFLFLLGFSFLGFFTTYALLTWLPSYLSDALGVPTTRAGALAALVSITMTVSSPLVGKLSDMVPRRRVLLYGSLLNLGAFTMLATTHSVPLVLVAGIIAGTASAMNTAPLMVFAGERFGRGRAGLAVGMVNAIGQTGSSLSGVVFGPLLDFTKSFAVIWWTCIPIAAVRVLLLQAVSDAPESTG